MFPDNTTHNLTYGSLAKAILFRQFGLRDMACSVALSDFSHNLFSQLRPGRFFTVCIAVLGYHVLSVFKRCTEKQMIGANALGIVATMANKDVTSDGSKVHLIREPMGKNHPCSDLQTPIVSGIAGAHPKPTSISLLNICPKALFKWLSLIAWNASEVTLLATVLAFRKIAAFDFKRLLAVLAIDGNALVTALASTITAAKATFTTLVVSIGEFFTAILADADFSGECVTMGLHAKPQLSCATPLECSTTRRGIIMLNLRSLYHS